MQNYPELTFREYQTAAGNTDQITEEQFKKSHYYILGANGEASEMLEKVVAIPEKDYFPSEESLELIVLEISDVAWYCVREIHALEGTPSRNNQLVDDLQSELHFPINFNRSLLLSTAIKISIETGKTSDITKKIVRDNYNHMTVDVRDMLICHFNHIFELCAVACSACGYKFSDALNMNLNKLASRLVRGVISGSGDKR